MTTSKRGGGKAQKASNIVGTDQYGFALPINLIALKRKQREMNE